MRNILYSSEIVGTVTVDDAPAELHVVIDAKYDDGAMILVSTVDTFLCAPGSEKRVTTPGNLSLPGRQTIREHVDLTEALDAARQVFRAATRKAHEIVAPAFR